LKVGEKVGVRVGRSIVLLDDDSVALKGEVGLVGGEEKGKKVGFNTDRVTKSNLAIVSVFNLVRKDKFTKVQEGMKTSEKFGEEEEVVV
jgi:hypothetical protein